MDLITFIKKEEPVEYVLTTDDQGKVKEESISKEMTVISYLPIPLYDFDLCLYKFYSRNSRQLSNKN